MTDDIWPPTFPPREPRERVSRWGHQVDHPRLEVRCDRPPEKRFGYMNRAAAKIGRMYERRGRRHPVMWQRPHPLPDLLRPRPHIVPGHLRLEVAWLRSDCTEIDLRFARWLMETHNARTLEVGYWDGKQTRPLLREAIAERLGEPGLPLSLDQVDRVIARFRAWGWIWRRERRYQQPDGTYRSGAAELKVQLKFLADWGVAADRASVVRKLDLREKQAQARRRGDIPPNPKAARHISDHARRLARLAALEERELGPYRERVRRELPRLSDWDVEREARRRHAADHPERGPPR